MASCFHRRMGPHSLLILPTTLFLHHAMLLSQGLSMRFIIYRMCLLFLLFLSFSAGPLPGIQQEREERHSPASSLFEPVYGPLSEQIVADFQLTNRKGIGIDLGSGPVRLRNCRQKENRKFFL
jgi:hypothetical protein